MKTIVKGPEFDKRNRIKFEVCVACRDYHVKCVKCKMLIDYKFYVNHANPYERGMFELA